jgi:hypothetical protein
MKEKENAGSRFLDAAGAGTVGFVGATGLAAGGAKALSFLTKKKAPHASKLLGQVANDIWGIYRHPVKTVKSIKNLPNAISVYDSSINAAGRIADVLDPGKSKKGFAGWIDAFSGLLKSVRTGHQYKKETGEAATDTLRRAGSAIGAGTFGLSAAGGAFAGNYLSNKDRRYE